MKTFVELLGIGKETVGEKLYGQISSICPEGAGPYSFSCRLPEADPRVVAIIDHLTSAGYHATAGGHDESAREFWLRLDREYDRSDYESASYLVPKPQFNFRSYTRTEEGYIELQADPKLKDVNIGFATWAWVAVADGIRSLIEAAGLEHVVFSPTVIVGHGSGKIKKVFWEVTSDCILPPISPSCTLVDAERNPFSGDFSKGCHLQKGFDHVAELHYLASSMGSVEPFDMALTYEMFGNGGISSRRQLVASQRFYQFCVKQKLKMDWVPVRLDLD